MAATTEAATTEAATPEVAAPVTSDSADNNDQQGLFGGLISREFFSAGPGAADRVMAGMDVTVIVLCAIAVAGLVPELLWLRRRQRAMREKALAGVTDDDDMWGRGSEGR